MEAQTDTIFQHRIQFSELQPGDCLLELPIESEGGDLFSVRSSGIVTLGHHPESYSPAGADVYQLTTACWQAYLLVLSHPRWFPRRILRPIWPVNPDDALAELLVKRETRAAVFNLPTLDRLLKEIAVTDVLGPRGNSAMAGKEDGPTLMNAVYNRANAVLCPYHFRTEEAARVRLKALSEAILSSAELYPEPYQLAPPSFTILREDGRSVMAECGSLRGLDFLYREGYVRAILVSNITDSDKRYASVGQVGAFHVNSEGLLEPLPPIDWSKPNELESGWGGRSTIGGGPREGTVLMDDQIWEKLKL